LSESLNIPLENLLTPSLLRSLAWAPPDALTVDSVSSALAQGGARAWQIAACAELICDSFVDAESMVDEPEGDLAEDEPAPGVADASSSLANDGDST
jgi:ribonuclease D